jgi:hypothetical protein
MTVYADDVVKIPLKPIAYVITESENESYTYKSSFSFDCPSLVAMNLRPC